MTTIRRYSCAQNAFAIAMLAISANMGAAAQQRVTEAAPQAAACTPRNAITATVKSVTDGRTFTLADGREIRLSAVETTADAQAALSALATGREVILSPLVPPVDRYGRLNMRAFVAAGAQQQSVEASLISAGVAFATPRGDDDACMKMLIQAERAARSKKSGVWNDDARKSMRAENPAALTMARGKFAVIEGKVISVRESSGTIYVNFGRRWSEDFTVTILKRNARTFTDAGIEPKRLEGRNVRVRGFIEERGGPWIEAAMPQQIEIAE